MNRAFIQGLIWLILTIYGGFKIIQKLISTIFPSSDGNESTSDKSSKLDNSQPDNSKKDKEKEEIRKSYEAHKQASQRDVPVELGETYEIVIDEVTYHHTGRRDLKGEYVGFVIFVIDPPKKYGKGDVVKVQIKDIGRKGTSAKSRLVGE